MSRAFWHGVLVMLSVSWSSEAGAQRTLRGKVFAPEDHAPGEHDGKETFEPLPGATVMWKGSGTGNRDGRFWVFQLDVRRN